MSLVLPDVSVTPGPTYATLLNAAYTLIDSHDHSTGKGIKVTPSGMNISSDLTFASNNATNLRTARLYNNTSITLGVNDKTCVYSLNNELYYVDGVGNNVQVTTGGALNIGATSALTINDSAFVLQYFGDTTRKFRFDASAVPASTTRVIKIPESGANDTLVSLAATQTLTNKTLTAAILTGGTAVSLISGAGTLVLPTTGTVTVPSGTDTLANLAGTQTITGKVLTGNTIATFTPNGGTNTITVPAITDTLVTKTSTDVLTNKTLSGNIAVTLVSGAATVTLPTTTGTLATLANAETLSSKTLTTPIISTTANFTEVATPAAAPAGTLKLYAKTDDNFYSINSAGLEQQIGAGSSGGAINYISNNGFENGTVTGWATYADAAGTTPVHGTGGAPASTFAINSSSPLRGTYDGLWTKSAANRQGEGFSYAFTLAAADVSKTLQLTFDSKASANLVSGDVAIYVYDITNSVLITPSSTPVPTGTSSQYSVAFQATTSTSYRLIFHIATVNANAYTLEIDQISLSPVVRPMAAAFSDWQSYTPTYSAGFGTVTGVSARWRREGDTLHVVASCITGTTTAAIGSVSLPSAAIAIDSTKLSLNNTTAGVGDIVGTYGDGANTASHNGYMVPATGTSTSVVYISAIAGNTTNHLLPAASTSAQLGTGVNFHCEFIVPISGWSSNITLASTTPMIEYVYNTTTTDAADTTAFGYGAGGTLVPGALTAARLKRVRFQNPIQPTDRIVIEVRAGTTGMWIPVTSADSGNVASPLQFQNAVTYGLGYTATFISSTDLDINFGQYKYPSGATFASAGAAWAGTNYWRVAKYSSIGGAELAPATATSGGTVSGGTVPGSVSGSAIATGYLGEQLISTVGQTNYPATATFGDGTSLSLTAGVWDITAVIYSNLNGATMTESTLGISTTTGNSTTGLVVGSSRVGVLPPTSACDSGGCIAALRATLSATTIYYLKVRATFSAGTPQNACSLRATRVG